MGRNGGQRERERYRDRTNFLQERFGRQKRVKEEKRKETKRKKNSGHIERIGLRSDRCQQAHSGV